ncbi:MAG: diaminopimelate decarboxylase [Propionibacteriaceae bacterium]|jgi:diaminopimelate decarboxylase|nr:diaminopimelate decarboxylase [Propionibacteriaceae bacterium]
MSHTHVAGSIHADAMASRPNWLVRPDDLNWLNPALWPTGVERDPAGAMTLAGRTLTALTDQFDSPAYFVDEAEFRARARAFALAFDDWDVYYAGKAFLCRGVARWIDQEGLGLDVCSGNELTVALKAGFPAARIGFHGNNKSLDELRLGLQVGVGHVIVDSLDEIERIEALAQELGVVARVLVRVTTGVEAHTHEYIATAHEDQKFGFSILGGHALMALVRCQTSPWIDLAGVHSHIGSQIFETDAFQVAAQRTMRVMAQFRDATGVGLVELNLGGGFGIAYTDDDTPPAPAALKESLALIVERARIDYDLGQLRLAIEPGRAICGPAMVAVYTVGTVKVVELDGGAQRVYVAVDGGMSDNIRPALYAAEYSAVLANRSSAAPPALCRVVGKHCEGGDILVRDVFLPADIAPGDLIAVPAAGAYARSMASNYNHLTRPPVVAVNAERAYPLLRRETLDDLLGLDVG